MKRIIPCLVSILFALAASAAGQTLNWGSEVLSDLRDSGGTTLDSGFRFELGAFAQGFTPVQDNVHDWLANWYVFDRAEYNESIGYFTSTTQMTDAGLSASQWLSAGAPSFAGLDAYLWIRKGDLPVPGSQWLVARAGNWIYPNPVPGCCDNELPVEWSVSDLTVETPKWGSQNGVQGPGFHLYDGPHTLQTYTFVPEPSVMLSGSLVALLLCRRRRDA